MLPKRPTGTTWTRGAEVKARWELTASHGGGYQYRLCPADAELNEACFSKTPVSFAMKDGEYFHTVVDKTTGPYPQVKGVVVETGGGIGWVLHPYGYASDAPCDWNPGAQGQHCEWPCPKCKAPWWAADGACPDQHCSHHNLPNSSSNYGDNFNPHPPRSDTIEDSLMVPSHIDAGEYVLQWRWDCEATSQIWTSCADITVV